MTDFPYRQYEGTELWNSVEAALEELKQNDDIVITTPDRYVIGYLTHKLSQRFPAAVLTPEETGGLHNAVNEVCNGIHIEDWEFQTRLGITRTALSKILEKI